jgi:hypothetical protein
MGMSLVSPLGTATAELSGGDAERERDWHVNNQTIGHYYTHVE